MTGSMGMYEIITREITGRPDACVYSLEALNYDEDGIEGTKVELCDPPPLFKSGPRKGKLNYSKATGRAVRIITRVEFDQLADAWSERTGLCRACMGDGKELASWSAIGGTTYRACSKCNGTGEATVAA